jgi:hypothetical protein
MGWDDDTKVGWHWKRLYRSESEWRGPERSRPNRELDWFARQNLQRQLDRERWAAECGRRAREREQAAEQRFREANSLERPQPDSVADARWLGAKFFDSNKRGE